MTGDNLKAIESQIAALLGSTPWERQALVIAEQIEAAEAKGRAEATEQAAQWLEEQLECYPTNIFIPPEPGKHGKTVDGCSAAAIRAIIPAWAKYIRALSKESEPV